MNASGSGRAPQGAAPRLAAARAAAAVLERGQALDQALIAELAGLEAARDRALARRLAHGLLRDWPAVARLLEQLLSRPPARRDRLIRSLLAIALAELRDAREPARAVVHSAVEAARLAGLARQGGLVNAVLRGYQRRRAELEAGFIDDPVLAYGYPRWLIEAIRRDWPEDWPAVLRAGNDAPPLWLRVNRRRQTRADALAALAAAGFEAEAGPAPLCDALLLRQRAAIGELPGFDEGLLSVQDAAAQLTVAYLELAGGLRLLDACAAPGGKAAHALERAEIDVTALDIDGERLGRVEETLRRLGLAARLAAVDAAQPERWWDGRPFDRILIDAPCSATGVIRRHPDVRWLRQASDLPALVAGQQALLDALWPLLAPGGILVYATCSVLAAENEQQMMSFAERHGPVEFIDHPGFPGRRQVAGRQILPGEGGMDGFYHCAVRRLRA